MMFDTSVKMNECKLSWFGCHKLANLNENNLFAFPLINVKNLSTSCTV